MRQLPTAFEERLRHEFRGRVRVRWSAQRGTWLIEQKELTQEELDPLEEAKLNPMDDILVRARDGYSLLFEVWPGTLVPCRHCGADLRLPQPRKLCKLDCNACEARGKNENSTFAAGYDLDSNLLEAIRQLDFVDHSGEAPRERMRRINAANARRREISDRFARDEQRYSIAHDWRAIAMVPRTGYRQPTDFWLNAPKSQPFIKKDASK